MVALYSESAIIKPDGIRDQKVPRLEEFSRNSFNVNVNNKWLRK